MHGWKKVSGATGIKEKFITKQAGKPVSGAFCFKLLFLDKHGKFIKLYRTDAFSDMGDFCTDKKLGKFLVKENGPYVNSAQSCTLFNNGILDWQTLDELMEKEAIWWATSKQKSLWKKTGQYFYMPLA